MQKKMSNSGKIFWTLLDALASAEPGVEIILACYRANSIPLKLGKEDNIRLKTITTPILKAERALSRLYPDYRQRFAP